MTRSDLARYTTPFVAPTHVSYRGLDVYSTAPSSSGGSTVGEALNILRNFDLVHTTRVQALHYMLEASRLAFADRNRYVGDRRYVPVPLRALLSGRYGRQRACAIQPASSPAGPVAPGDPFASGGCPLAAPASIGQPQEGANTNHFVVADSRGDVVSYTNTIEQLGGSAVAVPHRGFLLNNELTDFNFAPLAAGVPDPNLPASGKRPRSSMSPTIVLRHRRPLLAVGAAGGSTIITTVLQTLVNRLNFGLSLPAALAAPRISQSNAARTHTEPAFLGSSTARGLEALGESFSVTDTSPLNPMIKIAPTIGVASGLEFLGHHRVRAVAEPARRGGGVAGALGARR